MAAVPGMLRKIASQRRRRVEQAKERCSLSEMDRQMAASGARQTGSRSLLGAVKEAVTAAGEPAVALIAEVKRASPSAGVLRREYDPAALVRLYEEAGADAVSVLTEPDFFGGSAEDLRRVRQAVDLPVLRKDFIIDPYQVAEAKRLGADAVLLIAALLDLDQLRSLLAAARNYRLDALVEVHTRGELRLALAAGARLIGINNRDLHDFTVSLDTTEDLVAAVPARCAVVSESGIGGPEDVRRVAEAGAEAVLVGTSLMRSSRPAAAADRLTGVPRGRRPAPRRVPQTGGHIP